MWILPLPILCCILDILVYLWSIWYFFLHNEAFWCGKGNKKSHYPSSAGCFRGSILSHLFNMTHCCITCHFFCLLWTWIWEQNALPLTIHKHVMISQMLVATKLWLLKSFLNARHLFWHSEDCSSFLTWSNIIGKTSNEKDTPCQLLKHPRVPWSHEVTNIYNTLGARMTKGGFKTYLL